MRDIKRCYLKTVIHHQKGWLTINLRDAAPPLWAGSTRLCCHSLVSISDTSKFHHTRLGQGAAVTGWSYTLKLRGGLLLWRCEEQEGAQQLLGQVFQSRCQVVEHLFVQSAGRQTWTWQTTARLWTQPTPRWSSKTCRCCRWAQVSVQVCKCADEL